MSGTMYLYPKIKSVFMFDLEKMKEAVEIPSFHMPLGLNKEQKRFLILLAAKDDKTYREIETLNDENMKGSIKEMMFDKREWDSEILTSGGISYYTLENPDKRTTSDGKLFKTKYRVAMTSRNCDKLLKFRIKTASGAIFSVAAKTCGESQLVVDSIFGAGMYRVSQMLY